MSRYGLVDSNNFFVSCERIFRPDIVNKPVAVLSNNDGCIIARSNEVKQLGVAMGIPLFQVRDIVRQHKVQLFSANFELYGDVSQRIVELLREETPLVEVYSIDECFIDMSELPVGDSEAWGRRVRERVLQEVGVPVSVGIASTKTLAKVASTFAKSHGDGVWVAESESQRYAMLDELPIEEVWGIGRRIAPKLRDKGVSTAGQLVSASDAWLRTQFNITGLRMVDELRGVSRLPFGDKDDQRKSIMRSRSFGHRVRALHELEAATATFASQVAERLRAQDSVCSGVVVFASVYGTGEQARRYKTVSRYVSFAEPTADTGALITASLQGLSIVHEQGAAYKKTGVVAVGIRDVAAWQLSLLQGSPEKREATVELMNALDSVNKRYGSGTLWHASEQRQSGSWRSKQELRSPRYTTSLGELPKLYR